MIHHLTVIVFHGPEVRDTRVFPVSGAVILTFRRLHGERDDEKEGTFHGTGPVIYGRARNKRGTVKICF